MGIKFRCPNGHKLHVKAFLAGKRGICPTCGTKFDIPLTSGGQVAAVGGTHGPSSAAGAAPLLSGGIPASASVLKSPSLATSEILPTTEQPEPRLPQATALEDEQVVSTAPSTPGSATSPMPPPVPTPIDPLAEVPDALWHVRSATGGQFGPAAADILRQWLDEGRVTDDSFVWRDGWAEWRKASEVFSQWIASDATFIPPLAPATSPIPTAATTPIGPASRHKAGRRQSKQSAMMVSAILLLAVVVLAIVLGIVFWFQN